MYPSLNYWVKYQDANGDIITQQFLTRKEGEQFLSSHEGDIKRLIDGSISLTTSFMERKLYKFNFALLFCGGK